MAVVIVPQGPNWPIAVAGHLLEQEATTPEKAINLEKTFWMKMGVLYPPKTSFYTNPVKVTPDGRYWVNKQILDNATLYSLISIAIAIMITFIGTFIILASLWVVGLIK